MIMHIFLAFITFLTLSTAVIWQIHSLVKKTTAHNKIINSLFIISSMLVLICYNNPIYHFNKVTMSKYLVNALNYHHDYAKYIFVTAIIGGFFISLLALLPRENKSSIAAVESTKRKFRHKDDSVHSANYNPENIKSIALTMYAVSWWYAGKLLYIGIVLTVNS